METDFSREEKDFSREEREGVDFSREEAEERREGEDGEEEGEEMARLGALLLVVTGDVGPSETGMVGRWYPMSWVMWKVL